MIRSTLLAILICATSTAGAYESSDGQAYALSCTADGYVLTQDKGGSPLYLGKSCDAFTDPLGAGTWCWANGGFVAEFGAERSIGFPRQELTCDPTPAFSEDCRC